MYPAQRGFRDRIEKYVSIEQPFEVVLKTDGSAEYDACCFCVDDQEKLLGDPYMVFYNQLSTPNGNVQLRSMPDGSAVFTVDLAKSVQALNKMVFCVSIDGSQTMRQIVSHTISVRQNGKDVISLLLTGADFNQEKAIISTEIYQKNGWRIAFPAAGFNGGLGDLLRKYGGEEDTKQSNVPQPTIPEPNSTTEAKQGNTPSAVLKILAVPVSIGKPAEQLVSSDTELFYYGKDARHMPKAIGRHIAAPPEELGIGHDEAKAVESISKFVTAKGKDAEVVFLSTGGIGSSLPLLRAVNRSPSGIKWMFVGVGGVGYGVLEDISKLSRRTSFAKYASVQEYIQRRSNMQE